jgi:RNA 2',3'-cyclic 3'-phosphodiesterase
LGKCSGFRALLLLIQDKITSVGALRGSSFLRRMAAANPSPTVRLFVAFWPSAATRDALLAHADAWSWPAAARRTRPERLQVTLHFLGSVESELVPVLKKRLDLAWTGCELLLDRAQVWPSGIAVIEATEVPPALAALQARLGERLEGLGLALEARRYRPHVTLARKAFGARPPPAPVRWHAGPGFALVQSLPGGRGYENLQVFG